MFRKFIVWVMSYIISPKTFPQAYQEAYEMQQKGKCGADISFDSKSGAVVRPCQCSGDIQVHTDNMPEDLKPEFKGDKWKGKEWRPAGDKTINQAENEYAKAILHLTEEEK